MAVLPLVGRQREVGVLDDLVDRVGEGGGALVVRGEAGIGKSALLAAARTRARDRGMLVLAAAGVQSEAHLPFAGLHQLLAVAARAQRRGAIAVAVAALERAAKLTDDPARRGSRLLRAAELAFELGRRDLVVGLLREAEPLRLSPLDLGRMAWIREMCDPGVPGDPARVRSLVETADRMSMDGNTELALRLLWAAATSGFWADRGRETWERVVAAAERVPVRDDDPRLLSILAYAAPIERGAVVIDRVSRWAPDRCGDPEAMRLLGNAAATVGAFDLSVGFLTASVAGLREQGRLAQLAQVLVLRAWAEIHLLRWSVAIPDAEEAGRLAQETAQPIWQAGAQVAEAMLAGLRGDEEAAEALTAAAEPVALPIGARAVLSVVQLARGLTALSAGCHADAYQHLRRMFDPGDPAYHHMESCWAIGNLAEAAVHSGHRDAAREVMEELERLAEQTPSPWFHVAMRYARPLLADDEDAEALYQAALDADLTRWPLDRARLLLAYGAWLRRQRRVAESRTPCVPPARRSTPSASSRGGPRPPGAARRRRDQPPAIGLNVGPAHPAGAADRPDGRRRALEPGDRAEALPVPSDGRLVPVPDLPEAGGHLTVPATRPARQRDRLARLTTGPSAPPC